MLNNIARPRIKGDTLYISFHRSRISSDSFLASNNPVVIRLKRLSSIKAKHSNIHIDGPFANQDSVLFSIDSGGELVVNNLNANVLNLQAGSLVSVYINRNNTIRKLFYSLQKESFLNIENFDGNIGLLQPVNVDSLANISISARAKDMKKYLQAAK